jgi:hypothetical protein
MLSECELFVIQTRYNNLGVCSIYSLERLLTYSLIVNYIPSNIQS